MNARSEYLQRATAILILLCLLTFLVAGWAASRTIYLAHGLVLTVTTPLMAASKHLMRPRS